MFLTEMEKIRFAEWLKQDADSNMKLARQLEKMPGLKALWEKKIRLAAAEELVAAELLTGESFTMRK